MKSPKVKQMTAKVELNRWLASHQAPIVCDFLIAFEVDAIVWVCVCFLFQIAYLSIEVVNALSARARSTGDDGTMAQL